MVSAKLCVKCKGKLLCGMKKCPILERFNSAKRLTSAISGNEFVGSSPPGIFVSWQDYPSVNIAPLAPPYLDDTGMLDMPEGWYGLPAEQIVSFREQLIRSNMRIDVNAAASPSHDVAQVQEIAMASKPTAVEITLKSRPIPKLSFASTVAPLGPAAELKDLRLIENPHIPKKIDYLVSDTDVKSGVALQELYDDGTPVSTLHKLLSAGTLGVRRSRKFVPTRWSITAVDSGISEKMIDEKVKSCQQISEFGVFHSKYLDNAFYVLLCPGAWAFEQLECWLPGGIWTQESKTFHIVQDHELYGGRKEYASNVEGAYYAARLAVAEYLAEKKRQAAAIVFREIGQDYNIPLGVWVIRENVRHALQQKPLKFGTMQLALSYLSTKLSVPMRNYAKESALIDYLQNQRRITQYFA